MQLPTAFDQPQQQLWVVEMPRQPTGQMAHHLVPAADAIPAVCHRHPRSNWVGRWPARQAKRKRFINGGLGRHAEPAQVGMAVEILTQRFQPIQRWHGVQFRKPFRRQTARIAQRPQHAADEVILLRACKRAADGAFDNDAFLATHAVPIGRGPGAQCLVQVGVIPVFAVKNRGDVLCPPFIGALRLLALGIAAKGKHLRRRFAQ